MGGRLLAVADAFEVMITSRPYKRPVRPEAARLELVRYAGTQFDPAVVRAFLSISIGDIRKVMGPMALLAEIPFVGVAPRLEGLAVLTGRQAVTAIGTASGIGALGALGALAPVTSAATLATPPSHLAGVSAPASAGASNLATGIPGTGMQGSPVVSSSANPQPPPTAARGASPIPNPNALAALPVSVSVAVSQPTGLSVPPQLDPVSSVVPPTVVPVTIPPVLLTTPLVDPVEVVTGAVPDLTNSLTDVAEGDLSNPGALGVGTSS